MSALDQILNEQDKLAYAKAIAKFKHLAYYFNTLEPKLISYYHILPSLFNDKTEEGIVFKEALREFLDKGDTDALAVYIKYYKSYVESRLEELPLDLKTVCASEVVGTNVQYKLKEHNKSKGNNEQWESPEYYLGDNNELEAGN